MADFFVSANGVRVVEGSIAVPYYGACVADLRLATGESLVSPVRLVLGSLTLTCAVYRQAIFGGLATVRLVGGAGGWGKPVAARAYQNPAGIPLSLVLRDVAAEVGETVVLAQDRSIGIFYAREAAPAQRVLRQLAGELWWVDPQGRTQVGPRPANTVESEATVEDFSGGKGWLTVATDDPAAWLPGATFTGDTMPGPITVAETRFWIGEANKLRLEVLTTDSAIASGVGQPSASDRAMVALRALLRAEDPGRVPAGLWEYSVASATDTTFDGNPTSQDFPLPPAVGWPYRPSLAGATCKPAPGTLVYVAFANSDPTRPVVVAFGPTAPERVSIDATTTITEGASASTINLGGLGAVALAKASPISTWAAFVVTAIGQIATYINAITPGTVTPAPALANPATTKVIGV